MVWSYKQNASGLGQALLKRTAGKKPVGQLRARWNAILTNLSWGLKRKKKRSRESLFHVYRQIEVHFYTVTVNFQKQYS